MANHNNIRTIAVVGGGWSTNVGNAFYNLGTLYLLRQIFPKDRIILICDNEGYWDFRHHQTPKNSLRFLDHIVPDYLVLHGCFLTTFFPRMWDQTFQRLRKRGTRLLFISAGLEHYSIEEVAVCREYIQRNPPFLFVSRDSITYSKLGDTTEFSYNGIDTAFFAPEAFPPIRLDLPPYIVCTFDKLPEPILHIEPEKLNRTSGTEFISESNRKTEFKFAGQSWAVEFPWARSKLATPLDKFYPYVEALLLPRRHYQTAAGPFMILRTDHQCNPWFVRKMYRAPNSFAWDLPEPYLALYANSALTLSDRVHACVVTLAYGKPAMLFSRSPRALIIERLGVDKIKQKPTSISQEKLQEEKTEMIRFLKSVPFP